MKKPGYFILGIVLLVSFGVMSFNLQTICDWQNSIGNPVISCLPAIGFAMSFIGSIVCFGFWLSE